jgi:uncharacterized protein (DUF58 family)
MIASKRLYVLLVLGVMPLLLSERFASTHLVGIIYDAVILLLLLLDWQLTPKTQLIEATRDVSDRLSIGRLNSVFIFIRNRGRSKLECRLKDEFPQLLKSSVQEFRFPLPAEETVRLEYALKPQRRGLYKFENISIRYLSFLGLFWRQLKVKADQTIKVYSDLHGLKELSIKLSKSTELGILKQRKRGQGTDFSSLREYTVGDDSKSIDWKATARRDRPVVRTYEAEREQRLLILIDAGRMMISDLDGLTKFDHALNAALSLALTGLEQDDQVGLGIFADKPIGYLPPRRGRSYLKNMLELSFNVEPRIVEPDYNGILSYFAGAQKGRSLIVLLTDLTDPTGSHILLSALSSLSPRHLPFCVALQDRKINEIANEKISEKISGQAIDESKDLNKIYQRAVALDLLTQRELALNVLTRRGCLVLDCPPQDLSNKLVDAYLDIKTRGKL